MNNANIVFSQRIITVMSDHCEQAELFQYMLDNHRTKLVAWLEEKCGIDPNTYEGGIKDWWGLGSVTLYELGLEFNFHYKEGQIVMTIGC